MNTNIEEVSITKNTNNGETTMTETTNEETPIPVIDRVLLYLGPLLHDIEIVDNYDEFQKILKQEVPDEPNDYSGGINQLYERITDARMYRRLDFILATYTHEDKIYPAIRADNWGGHSFISWSLENELTENTNFDTRKTLVLHGGGVVQPYDGLILPVGIRFSGESGSYGPFDKKLLEQTLEEHPIKGIETRIE